MNQSHISRLEAEHRWLDERLREERLRPAPDPFILNDLKRRKLLIKDRIVLARAGLAPSLAEPART